MENSLSIVRRFFANIIDIVIAGLFCVILFFLFTAIFGPEVTNTGMYVGTIGSPHSVVVSNPYHNQEALAAGEIWAIIIGVLGVSLSQLLGEIMFSATCGIRLLGGICVDGDDNNISKSGAMKKFLARVIYLPLIYCILTHVIDIRPTFAIIIIFIIAFIMLLKGGKNVIDTLTNTRTIKRDNK